MTFVVCAGVLVLSVLLSFRLAKFIKECDEREELVIIDLRKESVVAAAEKITREAVES